MADNKRRHGVTIAAGPFLLIILVIIVFTQSGDHHGQITGWLRELF